MRDEKESKFGFALKMLDIQDTRSILAYRLSFPNFQALVNDNN